jgi:4-hydroxy-3-methylbut-2-enyl diphosphate reductase
VRRAVSIVERALDKYSAPVFVRKEIVHNKFVVNSLAAKGAIFVDSLQEIPENCPSRIVVFSAHGAPPNEYKTAKELGLSVIDATCPLVKRVHGFASGASKEGKTVLLVGHKNHEEIIGTKGEIETPCYIIESIEDARSVDIPAADQGKMVWLSQTTLSITETNEIVDVLKLRFPSLDDPPAQNICYATENRQNAIADLAHKVDLVIVIGSQNSSNTLRLKEVAERVMARSGVRSGASDVDVRSGASSCASDVGASFGAHDAGASFGAHLSSAGGVCGNVIRVDSKEDFTDSVVERIKEAKIVGVTSGASVPEVLVDEMLDELLKYGFDNRLEQETNSVEINEFPLPKELK